jgi:sugar phosphate permease
VVYALVYIGFALARSEWHAWALFSLYGLFYGFTEGSEGAILAEYSSQGERGEAYGWYYLIVGMGSLPASLLFGAVWQAAGSRAAFLMSASVSVVAALMLAMFLLLAPSPRKLAS